VPDSVIGLDLGRVADPSTLTVLRRSLVVGPGGLPGRGPGGEPLYRFDCVHVERFALGISYQAVIASVLGVLGRPEVTRLRPYLAADATGLGAPIVDMIFGQSVAAECIPITITGGDAVTRGPWHDGLHLHLKVPKSDVCGALTAGLESGRLQVVPSLPLARALQDELLAFRTRMTRAANQTFGSASGAHDDLVMALALATWLGGSIFAPFRPAELGDRDAHLLDLESAAERQALAAGQEDERRARLNRKSCGAGSAFTWGPGGW
jgi:hypothetical protein